MEVDRRRRLWKVSSKLTGRHLNLVPMECGSGTVGLQLQLAAILGEQTGAHLRERVIEKCRDSVIEFLSL